MKKLLFKILIFISPVLIGIIIMELGLSSIDNGYSFKKRNFEKNIRSIQVLNLGTSHADYGIDPDYFSLKGFNFANVGQPLYYDNKILQKYIDKMDSLKLVILPISNFAFGYDMSENQEYWRMYFYKRYYDIDNEGGRGFNLRTISYFALYGQKESLKCLLKGFKVNFAEGYKTNGCLVEKNDTTSYNLKAISEAKGKERAVFVDAGIKTRNYSKNIEYLKSMIEMLRKRNIKVVIITTPVYKTYYDNINRKNYQDMQDNIRSITQEYGIKYYNYINDSRFSIMDFRDNDHLNPSGAAKFSKILNDEFIKNIG